MKSIKAKLVLIVIVLNALGGAVIIGGMNMAYQRNVSLISGALGDSAGAQMQAQLFEDMAGNRNRAIVIAAVLALVMAVTLVVSLKGLVFSRLDKVVHDATRMVGGDHATPIAVVRQDEIGELEADLEKFRALLLETMRNVA